ncbi:MAG TPA: DNA-binding response regulator [Ruminiclostridium sp.]|nr:DNA-binding response regulator [Ruminiclostridium sp.]
MYKVFVTEDEAIVREGIRHKLDGSELYMLCGEESDGELALPAILELKPDILITDIKMPFMDGLQLAKIVKRAMSWIKIIIISGYDEFEFAKEAISIGVDEYLLKPVNAKTLLATLDKVAERIEQERAELVEFGTRRQHTEDEQKLKRDSFFDRLVTGLVPSATAIEQAAGYNIDMIAKKYIIAVGELIFCSGVKDSIKKLKTCFSELLDGRSDLIWFFKGMDRFVLIVKGDTEVQVDEAIYEAAQTIWHGLKRSMDVQVTIGIGSVVSRIAEMPVSYNDAHKAICFLMGIGRDKIVGIDDIEEGYAFPHLDAAMNIPASERLKFATEDDIPQIVESFSDKNRKEGVRSLLYGYYWLMDIIVASSRLVAELGGNPKDIIPESENPELLLQGTGSPEKIKEFAADLLKRVIVFKNEFAHVKYVDILTKAKDFINNNFSDTSMSLNTVAKYTGFSPNHFSTIFSQQTGETFIEYLTKVRVENAKSILEERKSKLSEVAYAVGYKDPHYFSYIFKKNTGLTPRDYKKEKG